MRRPRISAEIRRDLRLIGFVMRPMSRLHSLRDVPIHEILDQMSRMLISQVDFELEASANTRLTACLSKENKVRLPYLVREYCSRSILTMEFLDEFHTSDHEALFDRTPALNNALKALYRMIFIEGFVHCDMHGGNCRLMNDGVVVLTDFGLMATLKDNDRLAFAEFFYAMVVNDGYTCAMITLEASSNIPEDLDKDTFIQEMISLVDKYSGKRVTCFQVSGFVVGLFDLQRRHHVRGTTEFTWAIISLLIFEGMAKTIDPELDFQGASISYLQHALNMRRRRVTSH